MKRLTKKLLNGTYTSVTPLTNNGSSRAWLFQLGKKLGQLEDIEEELGIDLITLIKAFKYGIYHKKYPCPCPFALLFSQYSDNTFEFHICAYGDKVEIKLKDYGKTWALTKEELL